MAFDEGVAQRLREVLGHQAALEERRMFGGIAFMLGGHMCCGVLGEELVARVGRARHEALMARPHVRVMDFTGRPMRGFLLVAPEAFARDSELQGWVDECVDFVRTLPPK